MAKKRSRKKSPSVDTPAPDDAVLSYVERRNLERKLVSLLREGQDELAEKTLQTLWPADEPDAVTARIVWLLIHAPAHGVDELRAYLAAHPADETLLQVVSSTTLTLEDEHLAEISALPGFGDPWRAQAENVRAAAHAMSAGNDAEVYTRLQAVSPASPFTDVCMFLFGLLAHYENDEDAVMALLEQIDWGSPLQGAAERLRDALTYDAFTGAEAALAKIVEAARMRQFSRALDVLAASQDELSAVQFDAVTRALSAAMVHAGIDPTDAVERLSRALRASPRDPDWRILLALLLREHPHGGGPLVPAWRALGDEFQRVEGEFSAEERAVAPAALLGAFGEICHSKATRMEVYEVVTFGADGYPENKRLREIATEYYHRAIEASPDSFEHWQRLVEIQISSGYREESKRTMREIVARFASLPQALTLAGYIMLNLNEVDEAEEYLQKALALDPTNSRTWKLMAIVLLTKAPEAYRRGEVERARALYERATQQRDLGERMILRTRAALAGFDMLTRDGATQAGAADKVAEHCPDRLDPWPWVILVLLELTRLRDDDWAYTSLELAAPTAYELYLLDRIFYDIDNEFDEMPAGLWQAFKTALERSYKLIDDAEMLELWAERLRDDVISAHLLRRAHQRAPDNLIVHVKFLERAMDFGLPPEAFKGRHRLFKRLLTELAPPALNPPHGTSAAEGTANASAIGVGLRTRVEEYLKNYNAAK